MRVKAQVRPKTLDDRHNTGSMRLIRRMMRAAPFNWLLVGVVNLLLKKVLPDITHRPMAPVVLAHYQSVLKPLLHGDDGVAIKAKDVQWRSTDSGESATSFRTSAPSFSNFISPKRRDSFTLRDTRARLRTRLAEATRCRPTRRVRCLVLCCSHIG